MEKELLKRNCIKMIKAFLICLSLLCTDGCAAKGVKEMSDKETVKIMCASDLHYLSEELYDPASAIFAEVLEKNDGKLIEGGSAILQALKEKALEEKPDVLLLAGDITFNGEMISLKEIASVLKEIEEGGVPVLVTTGNHDIYYSSCMTYFGDLPQMTEDISDAEYAEVLGAFGYEEALKRDAKTLSYVYELNDHLWFLVLDANSLTSRGSIPGETLSWMDEVLSESEEKGITVIAMSHQNVLIQSEMMYMGYVLDNHSAVENILRDHGVNLVISGHSHLQHTAESDGLTDICCESLSVYPLQYGLIDYNTGSREFTHKLATLGILEQESFDRFEETVLRMVSAEAEKASDDEAIQKEMEEFAVQINAAYFSGNHEKIRSLMNENGRTLWETYGSDSFWSLYIRNIFSEVD